MVKTIYGMNAHPSPNSMLICFTLELETRFCVDESFPVVILHSTRYAS